MMQHLAIIPDGNRRWARQHKLESVFGHRKGMEVVRAAITACIKNSIKYLSFYTFSLENFKRSEFEKTHLFNLLAAGMRDYLPELVENKIRVQFVGDRSQFPKQLHHEIEQLEQQTQQFSRLTVILFFCYGATFEIAQAAKTIAHNVKNGLLAVDDINEQTIRDCLWTSHIPDPDLIIRTGCVARLSNFLLFQAAYTEFAFLDCYWPEMTEEKITQCLEKYRQTQKNVGR